MPYTGNPSSNTIDAVRLEIGDIDPDFPILADADYTYFLTKNNNSIRRTALDAAKSILFALSRMTHEKTDVLEIWGHEYVQNYRESLKMFIKDPNFSVALNNAMPFAGGIEKDKIQENLDDPNAQVVDPERSIAAGTEGNPFSQYPKPTDYFSV